MEQKIISGYGCHRRLGEVLKSLRCKKFLLVCGPSFSRLPVKDYISSIGVPYAVFGAVKPNPLYGDVCAGVEKFREEGCDSVVAVGGGSAIDVAKCIKLFSPLDEKENYLTQEKISSSVPLIAIPTTAGTGSESTRFAVIYYGGKKQSVTHPCIVPDFAILDCSLLRTLPLYLKKCAMLDALCQGIESWWSVNSTEESRVYSRKATESIIRNYKAYISSDGAEASERIMQAANYAGRAINIAQTTAPHAMSYKLTSLYSLPHGHAVAICLPAVWKYMIENISLCADKRGEEYLRDIFAAVSSSLGCNEAREAAEKFGGILNELGIFAPNGTLEEAELLGKSVNATRLANNPVAIDEDTLTQMYKEILNAGK